MRDSTATAVTATGQTGGTCQTSGPYKCNSHIAVLFFKRGDRFTNCPFSNGHATTWTIVSATAAS